MKTRDAESVLVIQASGFIGRHLGCRLIGLFDNAMAQVWPLHPGSPLPTPSSLAVVDQLCREGGFNLAVNACPSFLPDHPVPRRSWISGPTPRTCCEMRRTRLSPTGRSSGVNASPGCSLVTPPPAQRSNRTIAVAVMRGVSSCEEASLSAKTTSLGHSVKEPIALKKSVRDVVLSWASFPVLGLV